jgi:hypothetical protein
MIAGRKRTFSFAPISDIQPVPANAPKWRKQRSRSRVTIAPISSKNSEAPPQASLKVQADLLPEGGAQLAGPSASCSAPAPVGAVTARRTKPVQIDLALEFEIVRATKCASTTPTAFVQEEVGVVLRADRRKSWVCGRRLDAQLSRHPKEAAFQLPSATRATGPRQGSPAPEPNICPC